MKRTRKKNTSKKRNLNQLSFDFTQNISIEIHIPRRGSVNYREEFKKDKKMIIELVRT